MKICFFHSGFVLHGGIERVLSIVVRNLSLKEGMELYCLSLSEAVPLNFYSLPSSLKLGYLFTEQINMKTAFIKGGIGRLVKYLKNNRIDVIVAFGSMYFPMACISGKIAGAKIICWEHTSPETKNEFAFQGVSRGLGARFSDRNVLIAEEARKYYEKYFRKKRNLVIYNPAESQLFDEENAYQQDSRKLISVGRLTYQKNYPLLIDIAEKLLEKYNDWSWHIYGDGEQRAELEAKIVDKGLAGKLVLMGNVANLYDRYPEYAAIVMTSRYEGFPMVLIEAAAKGLPMVSFDISTGPKEIIDDGVNGFLIPNGDVDGMLTKLAYLMENQELRSGFSIEAKRKATSFRVDHIVDQWCQLFEEIMQ